VVKNREIEKAIANEKLYRTCCHGNNHGNHLSGLWSRNNLSDYTTIQSHLIQGDARYRRKKPTQFLAKILLVPISPNLRARLRFLLQITLSAS
jgi:hypothetical protein